MKSSPEFPYQALGQKLRAARVRKKRTVAEASGAIEVNEDILKSIELGKLRPEEDTLNVLISYLDIAEEEATGIWDLAGYNKHDTVFNIDEVAQEVAQSMAMIMPNDLRVVYTDMVHVMVNDYGVIMNFLQGGGPNNQPLAVSRIGMSKDHARSIIELLQKSLNQAEQKPSGKQLQKPSSKTSSDTPKSRGTNATDNSKQ